MLMILTFAWFARINLGVGLRSYWDKFGVEARPSEFSNIHVCIMFHHHSFTKHFFHDIKTEFTEFDVFHFSFNGLQEAEVGNNSVPEPFDVKTEHAVEARALNFDEAAEVGTELGVSNGE